MNRQSARRAQVAVVGGGLAGAAIGARLAREGYDVLVLERTPHYRWRACGVFASPSAVAELGALGLDPTILAAVLRPIPAMRVEASDGSVVRLTYGVERDGGRPAVGFDRSLLDPALLDLARRSGVDVRTGVSVSSIARSDAPPGWNLTTSGPDGESRVQAQVLVGADGIRSTVARQLGVARRVALAPRIGLTYHLSEEVTVGGPRDARMVVIPGGYCGIAPVPDGRMNVGIVLGGRWRARLRADGAQNVCASIIAGLPNLDGDDDRWRLGQLCEPPAGADPLGHAVTHRAGPDWILVGDAAGFLDPFTGEGIHRALVSSRLGADAVVAQLRGRTAGLGRYEHAMDRAFRAKDVVSWVVQAFLTMPPAFNYAARRLARRRAVRETMGLVMGDLVPASRALDPRFLATLLAP